MITELAQVFCDRCERPSTMRVGDRFLCDRHGPAARILAFRATHKIEPRFGQDWTPMICGFDGVPIYAIKSGWRHDVSYIRRLERPAEPPDPETCPTCEGIKANGGFGPPHKASPGCESGKRNHCSCDVCF